MLIISIYCREDREFRARKVKETFENLEKSHTNYLKDLMIRQQQHLQVADERYNRYVENRKTMARKDRLQRTIRHNRRMQGLVSY